MKILFVIYLVLLSFICRVHAQENSGLTFGQVQPIWSKYFKPKIWEHRDVAALTTVEEPIYDGLYVYFISNLFDSVMLPGYHIEKLNLENGQSIWTQTQFTTAINTRELISKPFLGEDGNLNMIIGKEVNSNPFLYHAFWNLANLKIKKISGEDGDLIFDGQSQLLEQSATIGNPLLGQISLGFYNNNFLVFDHYFVENLFSRRSREIDQKGVIIDTLSVVDTLHLPFAYMNKKNTQDNKTFYLVGLEDPDTQARDLIGFYFNLNGELVSSKSYMSKMDPSYNRHDLIGFENGILTVLSKNNSNNMKLLTTITIEGEILEKIKIENGNTWVATKLTKDNTLLFGIYKETTENLILELYKTNGESEIEKKLILVPDDSDALVFLSSIHITPENNLLLNLNHRSRNNANIPNSPTWKNWTLLSGTEIGLISGISDSENKIYYSITPNPSSHQIIVTIPEIKNDVTLRITDQMGRSVWVQDIYDTEIGIDISSLASGMYFVSLQDAASGMQLGKVQKLVKVE